MALINVQTITATAITASATTHTALTPVEVGSGSGSPTVGFLFTTTLADTAATATITAKVQGTVDGTTYVDVLLLPNDSATAAASFAKTTAASWVWFVADASNRKFQNYRLVTSANTNISYLASMASLS